MRETRFHRACDARSSAKTDLIPSLWMRAPQIDFNRLSELRWLSALRAHPVRGKGRAHLEQQLRVRTFFQPDSCGLNRRNRERKVVDGSQAATRAPQPGTIQETS
jgi:hypothetical protein